MSKQLRLIPLIMFAAAAPASAERFRETSGPWTIQEHQTGHCSLAGSYKSAGETFLYVALYPSGDIGLTVSNQEWTLRDGERYPAKLTINGSVHNATASSVRMPKGSTLAVILNRDFLQNFAKGKALRMEVGGQTIDLELYETSGAVLVLERCVAHMASRSKAVAGSAQKAQNARAERGPRGPIPDSPQDWAWKISESYPRLAAQNRWEGNVFVTLEVNTEGRVATCTVAQSSGHKLLDETACASFVRFARFKPAIDSTGAPIPSRYRTNANFKF